MRTPGSAWAGDSGRRSASLDIDELRTSGQLPERVAKRLTDVLDLALGQAWDDELEPFRYAVAGAPVRWLHRVG